MAERRTLDLGPEAGAVGRHQQQASLRRQHPPQLAQQGAQAFRLFQPMHHQQRVEERIGKRQRVFLDQGGEASFLPARRRTPRGAGMAAMARSASGRKARR